MSNVPAEDLLLTSAIAGDAAALTSLLHRYRSDVERYVVRHLPADVRSLVDPQDIVQDVHFEAFRRIGSFRPQGDQAFLRWILTIGRSRVLDVIRYARSAKRNVGRQVDNQIHPATDEASVVALLTDLRVYARTPSESVLSREAIGVLAQCMERLSSEHREVLQLRYLEDLPVTDVAAQISKSQGAVHMACQRALQALRAELTRHWNL